MKIVNATPHALTFDDGSGNVVTVPAVPGNVVTAKAVETPAGNHPSGAVLVKTAFVGTPEAEVILSRLEAENPDAVIVGSIIAAQAFPGRVFAMVPAVGFERVPPDQKRMRLDKFTTY